MVYFFSILFAKYSDVKVSLKSRKTYAYTKLSTTKVWQLIQCIKKIITRFESTT